MLHTLRQWLPLIGLTLSAFVFNTSEFMPVGLLTDIASGFAMSEAAAGQVVSVYAWLVALLSLPLAIVFARKDSRRVLLCLVGLFVAAHAVSAWAPTFWWLMVSRAGVACAHALFWAIVSPLAMHVAPGGRKQLGLSMVMGGTAVAMIVGMPIGRWIGLALGWRMAFAVIGAVAFGVLVLLAASFPRVENTARFTLRELPRLLASRRLLALYLATFIAVAAHCTGYSYIEPFMLQVLGVPPGMVTLALAIFGFAGVVGSVVFARTFQLHPHRIIFLAIGGLTASLLLMPFSGFSVVATLGVCLLWGMAFTSFDLAFTDEVIATVPRAEMIVTSIYSGIFNVGIASGTMVGGAVFSAISLEATCFAGAIIGLVALAYCRLRLFKLV